MSRSVTPSWKEKVWMVPMLCLSAFRLLESLRQWIWSLFYITHLNLLLPFWVRSSPRFTLKLHISLLSAGKESCRAAANLSVFLPFLSTRDDCKVKPYFPVSRVSQLTKNLSFLVRIRSRLTVQRNFPPVPNRCTGKQRGAQEGGEVMGAPVRAWRQKESRLRSRRLDTIALRYSLSRAMLKPHELQIVPRALWALAVLREEFHQGKVYINVTLNLIRAPGEPHDGIKQALITEGKYVVIWNEVNQL